MKTIQQSVVLLIGALTIVGCGGGGTTSSSGRVDGANSKTSFPANSEIQRLKEQAAVIKKRIEEQEQKVRTLKSQLEQEKDRDTDKASSIADELSKVADQFNADLNALEAIYDKINQLESQSMSDLAPSAKSPPSKEPQTKQEYIDAILEILRKEYREALGEKESAEIREKALRKMQSMSIDGLKQLYQEAKAELGGASLSSGAVNLSHRDVRLGKGALKASNFNLNGQYLGQSIAFDLPVVVQLKGNLDTSLRKNSDAVGAVAYNFNGWVAGVVHGYVNEKVNMHESAVMISRSFKGFFVEGQMGAVSGANTYGQHIAGSRYLTTLGYDGSRVSPFLQYQHLSQGTEFGEVEKHGVYVGLDTDVLSVQTSDAILTSKILAKIGYEAGFKTNVSAYLEWAGGLKLSNGVEISNTLNIGSGDQQLKLSLSFED